MPNPCDYEDRGTFVSDCVSERQREDPAESTEQSVAVCNSMWDERECRAMPKDCYVNVTREAPPEGKPVYKAAEQVQLGDREIVFRASSEKTDRVGDIVRQNWVLANFRKNPVFAYGHRTDGASFPIGRVPKFWTEGEDGRKESFARVSWMPEGVDETADKTWLMAKDGFLNAVSVGFNWVERPEPLFDKDDRFTGFEFPKNELLELSLVMIPAHQDAMAIQREYKLSDDQLIRLMPAKSRVSAPRVAAAKRYVDIVRQRVR